MTTGDITDPTGVTIGNVVDEVALTGGGPTSDDDPDDTAMDAREQARVPGSQNTSMGAYGSGNVQGLLGQLQASRPSYF